MLGDRFVENDLVDGSYCSHSPKAGFVRIRPPYPIQPSSVTEAEVKSTGSASHGLVHSQLQPTMHRILPGAVLLKDNRHSIGGARLEWHRHLPDRRKA